jgi:hypothetical protein
VQLSTDILRTLASRSERPVGPEPRPAQAERHLGVPTLRIAADEPSPWQTGLHRLIHEGVLTEIYVDGLDDPIEGTPVAVADGHLVVVAPAPSGQVGAGRAMYLRLDRVIAAIVDFETTVSGAEQGGSTVGSDLVERVREAHGWLAASVQRRGHRIPCEPTSAQLARVLGDVTVTEVELALSLLRRSGRPDW